MGCISSQSALAEQHHHEIIYPRGPRFSYCNGRITRIIQDDLVDFCETSDNEQKPDEKDKISVKAELQLQKAGCEMIEVRGSWISGLCAGGSRNNVELFATNPQYEMIIKSEDGKHSTKIPVMIYLKQLHFKTRSSHIAFFIFKSEHKGCCLGAEHFLCEFPVYSTGSFKRREFLKEIIHLPYGTYVIIPTEFHTYDNEFIMQITYPKNSKIFIQKLITPTGPTIFYT